MNSRLKDIAQRLTKIKLVTWLVATVGPYLALILTVVLVGGAAVAVVASIAGKAESLFHGITSVVKLPGDLIDSLTGTDVDEKIKHELDCSNASKADRKAGNCINGLLDMGEAEQSPVPDDKAWLLPVWQAAATKYKIPWELVAAVNAARTNFGDKNCTSEFGDGFYRMYPGAWDAYKFDGGAAKTEEDGRCRDSEAPAKLKADDRKDVYDAVDATFAEARMLAEAGAQNNDDWDYSGSDPGACVTNTAREGQVYVMPAFTGGAGKGDLGFNPKLDIDRDLVEQASKYVYPLSRNGHAVPEATIRKMLVAVWKAFGASASQAEANARLNIGQVSRESGFKPNQMQTIDDINSQQGHPAQGLFQFVPSTFDAWKVPGYDDILNPLDNIIAAVNAQKYTDIAILDGSSGWGPGAGANPFLNTTGSSTPAAGGADNTSTGPKAYEGDPQSDDVSEAVAYNGPSAPDNSACYIAVVHDWYVGIKNNPPLGDVTAGGVRGRIVKIAQAEAKLGLHEATGSNDGQPAVRYEFAPGPQSPWCAYFTTWVWRKAGVNIAHYGMVSDVMNWGKQHNLFKARTAMPQPGDAIIYGASGNDHIGIVERVVGTKVAQVQFTTIEGNYSNMVARVGPTDVEHTGQYTYGFVSPARGGGSGTNPLDNPILPQGEDGHGTIQ